MNLLDRYIAGSILKGVAGVVMVLIAVVTAVEFVGQLDDVGTAQYEMQDALAFVALRTPRTIVQMLPAAALLGALLGLGNLALLLQQGRQIAERIHIPGLLGHRRAIRRHRLRRAPRRCRRRP